MLVSSEFYRTFLFCLLILRIVLCVSNETEPQSHWNHATITPGIHEEEKPTKISCDILKKDLKNPLKINGDMTSGDINLIQQGRSELSVRKNFRSSFDGPIYVQHPIEWLKRCLPIIYTENYTQILQRIDEEHSDFFSNRYYFNDAKYFYDRLQSRTGSFTLVVNIYKQFESIRELIISEMGKFENISDCSSPLIQQCLSSENFLLFGEEEALLNNLLNGLKHETFYLIDILVSVILLCIGMTLNVTLLLIFYKHKEIRILSNIVVLNIAINDLLCLVIVLPLHYITYNRHNYEDSIDLHDLKYIALTISQVFLSLVSVCSILTLSIQRCMAITKSFKISRSESQDLRSSRVSRIILPIWATAGVITALLTYLSLGLREDGIVIFTATFQSFLIVGGFILPTIVSIFNCRSANRMYRSAQDIPGEGSQTSLVNSRQKGSYLLIGFTISFWITHTPSFVWMIKCYDLCASGLNINYMYIETVISHLFFSNSILNPLSLCITSSVFRELFKKYLFECWWKKLSSVISQRKLPPNEVHEL